MFPFLILDAFVRSPCALCLRCGCLLTVALVWNVGCERPGGEVGRAECSPAVVEACLESSGGLRDGEVGWARSRGGGATALASWQPPSQLTRGKRAGRRVRTGMTLVHLSLRAPSLTKVRQRCRSLESGEKTLEGGKEQCVNASMRLSAVGGNEEGSEDDAQDDAQDRDGQRCTTTTQIEREQGRAKVSRSLLLYKHIGRKARCGQASHPSRRVTRGSPVAKRACAGVRESGPTTWRQEGRRRQQREAERRRRGRSGTRRDAAD